VATVTGTIGERIQAWRLEHDPLQARRLPPHTTLCYWVPPIDERALERQVRHAFAGSVEVTLDGIHVFDNEEHTFYVAIADCAGLDAARERLYDGEHASLGGLSQRWTWHVTCVRDSRGRDPAALRAAAAKLARRESWRISLIELLELNGEAYEPIAAWEV